MNIGKNIFTLRREKRWTQAELAEKLGVSDQTVSKWENGQTAPDVSQFPVLARLFGVSIDRLFGYQSHSYDEEVEAILKAADACGSTRREIELLTDGLARYPNSAKLRTSLAFSLLMLYRISEDGEERRSAIERAVSLCGEALQTGGDPRELDEAMHMLCRIRTEIGDYERAKEAAERIGPERHLLRVLDLSNVLYAGGDRDAFAVFAADNLYESWYAAQFLLDEMTNDAFKAGELDRAKAYGEARMKLLSVFDAGCADYAATDKLFAAERLARIAKAAGDRGACLDALKRFDAVARQIPAVAASPDFHAAARNPLFFGAATDGGIEEEYMSEVDPQVLFRAFDSFFGSDQGWWAFRAND